MRISTKDQKVLKKTELKNIVTEIKNTLERINSTLNDRNKLINELENQNQSI